MKTIFTQKLLKAGLMAFIFFLALSGLTPSYSQTIFNIPGTYTFVVTGQSNGVVVEVWGAGGSGGSNSVNAKGGGGGGGYARSIVNLAPGYYTVIVGAGGVATISDGVDGGGSSFKNGNTIIDSASGGKAGNGTTGGAGGQGITGTARYNGGKGGNGFNGSFFGFPFGDGGGGGGSALTGSNGSNGNDGTILGGGNGGNGQGKGGDGGDNGVVGDNGLTPGGGGGGKGYGNNKNSGNGADGVVRITGAVGAPLPVKLGNFQAYQKQSGIQIEWTTYIEIDVSRFEILRSSDGVSFSVIGQVEAKNIRSGASYSWFDATPLSGSNFYRLKSIDIDETFEYSPVVRISVGKSSISEFSVYPNPVTSNRLSFQSTDLAKGNYTMSMFDMSGNRVSNEEFTHPGGPVTRNVQLPAAIKPGMYMLQLSGKNSKISRTFIVQ